MNGYCPGRSFANSQELLKPAFGVFMTYTMIAGQLCAQSQSIATTGFILKVMKMMLFT
jgi:hypothetical protein